MGCHFFWVQNAFLGIQRSAKVVLILGYKKLFGDTKNFLWDTQTFLGYQKLFLGYKNFFWDTKTFFGIQSAFFRDTKSFWLTKIQEHHTNFEKKKLKKVKNSCLSNIWNLIFVLLAFFFIFFLIFWCGRRDIFSFF